MGVRRRARELAVQALFYLDMRGASRQQVVYFCQSYPPSKQVLPFFLRLIKGVVGTRSALDDVIERFSSNWKISRMSCVDRNVLRLGVYELLNCDDIPGKVSINEAIDIGKKYGTEESGAFINGILDSVRMAMEEGKVQTPMIVDPDVAEWRFDASLLMGAQSAVNDGEKESPGDNAKGAPIAPKSVYLAPGVRKRPAARH